MYRMLIVSIVSFGRISLIFMIWAIFVKTCRAVGLIVFWFCGGEWQILRFLAPLFRPFDHFVGSDGRTALLAVWALHVE